MLLNTLRTLVQQFQFSRQSEHAGLSRDELYIASPLSTLWPAVEESANLPYCKESQESWKNNRLAFDLVCVSSSKLRMAVQT